MPGYEDGVIGPIAQSVDDIELACRACFGAKYYESDTVIPIPYREVELKKVLRFGWYTSGRYLVFVCEACIVVNLRVFRWNGKGFTSMQTSGFRDCRCAEKSRP